MRQKPDIRGGVIRARETQPVEYLRTAGVAIVNAIPGVGGSVAAVLTAMPNDRERRLTELLARFADDLTEVADRLDAVFLRTEEFAAMFEETLERGVRRREADKRDYYAALLANAAMPDRPSETEWLRIVDALEALRPRHLRLLAVVGQRQSLPLNVVAQAQLRASFAHLLPDVELAAIEEDMADLAAQHIVVPWGSPWTSTFEFTDRLTPFGARFVEYLRPPADRDPYKPVDSDQQKG